MEKKESSGSFEVLGTDFKLVDGLPGTEGDISLQDLSARVAAVEQRLQTFADVVGVSASARTLVGSVVRPDASVLGVYSGSPILNGAKFPAGTAFGVLEEFPVNLGKLSDYSGSNSDYFLVLRGHFDVYCTWLARLEDGIFSVEKFDSWAFHSNLERRSGAGSEDHFRKQVFARGSPPTSGTQFNLKVSIGGTVTRDNTATCHVHDYALYVYALRK